MGDTERLMGLSCPPAEKVLDAARKVYIGYHTRLQPKPNVLNTDIYQLHIRTDHIDHDPNDASVELRGAEWQLVHQGRLEEILAAIGERSTSV